jgi:uncharacterized protein with PIN domain
MTFFEALDFRLAPIGERELALAMDAYARFGKGRHPAKLNMGDRCPYACAQANDALLLFKGSDFTKTDTESATPPRMTPIPLPAITDSVAGKDHPCPPITTS